MADPVTIFFERIDALGYLLAEGELLLGDFRNAIGDAARQLVAGLGHVSSFEQACREAPISKSFARACREADAEARSQRRRRYEVEPIPIVATHGVPGAARLQAEYERTIQRHRERYGPAKSTLDAAWGFVNRDDRDDPERFEAWLLEHPAAERAAIVAHIKNKEARS